MGELQQDVTLLRKAAAGQQADVSELARQEAESVAAHEIQAVASQVQLTPTSRVQQKDLVGASSSSKSGAVVDGGAASVGGTIIRGSEWRSLVNDKCSIAKAVFVGINYVGLGTLLTLGPGPLCLITAQVGLPNAHCELIAP